MALYKYRKKFLFSFPTTILTNISTTICHRHFYDTALRKFDRKKAIRKEHKKELGGKRVVRKE
jgi:hypothetical protein